MLVNHKINYYYDPWGMELPGRCGYSAEQYRYAYQGQYSERNSVTQNLDFMLRSYDPRIGRWTTTDPLITSYSAYEAMGNNPVVYVDPLGAIPKWIRNIWKKCSAPFFGGECHCTYLFSMANGTGNNNGDCATSGSTGGGESYVDCGASGMTINFDIPTGGHGGPMINNDQSPTPTTKVYVNNPSNGNEPDVPPGKRAGTSSSFKEQYNKSSVKKVLDDVTNPYVGLGLKLTEENIDDLIRIAIKTLNENNKSIILSKYIKLANKYCLTPASYFVGAIAIYQTANDPELSDERQAYDITKNAAPIAIDLAIYLEIIGPSIPYIGWASVIVGVGMEGAELFYDEVYTPSMEYLLDYSDRYQTWFIDEGGCSTSGMYSDKRLKTSIITLDSTITKISKLEGYRYKWLNDTNKYDIGLLAQEVELVFPELVKTDSSGMKKIVYIKFIPILLQAINDQSKIISNFEAEINIYQNQLKKQEQLINDINQRLQIIEQDSK